MSLEMFLQFDQLEQLCVGAVMLGAKVWLQSTFRFPRKIPHARTINFPSISGTAWPLACSDHPSFILLLLFTFTSFPPCHFHNAVDRISRNTRLPPPWCVRARVFRAVRTEFLWGFARCLVHRRRAITVPRYVTRSHLSRLGWAKGCTTGRWTIIMPTRVKNTQAGGRSRPLPSDIWFPWPEETGPRAVSFPLRQRRIRSAATPRATCLRTSITSDFR